MQEYRVVQYLVSLVSELTIIMMPDQDDATDLRIHMARCLVQGLCLDLIRCSAAWIRMLQLTLESFWRGV